MIYHWCPEEDWNAASSAYRPREFSRDGFVHCSYLHQVESTASRMDPGREGMVLLCIDEEELRVVVEDCYDTGAEYPHVYGPIPTTAVTAAVPFPPEPDGTFRLPRRLPR